MQCARFQIGSDDFLMISTSPVFWQAFFDPNNPNYKKARNAIKTYDKEQIIIDTITISNVLDWLYKNEKRALIAWFLDYLTNTSNVKIFYIGKEEFEILSRIVIEKQLNFSAATLEYLHMTLHYDIAKL